MQHVWHPLAAILLGGALLVQSPARAAESGDCIRGNPSAPIKIEVFSDFQCPACQAFYLRTMRDVLVEYGDSGKACIVYREFPLQMHAHARQAARYGHAAMRLGRAQWGQVADALFQNQQSWGASGDIESVVANVLSKNSLDALHKELEDETSLEAAINADINLGVQRGVNSTPTFFVTSNGKTEKIAAAVQYPILKRYLDSQLAKGN
jgi:protein-disulfide isomerase